MIRRRWMGLAAGCALAFVVLTIPIALGRDWPGEWVLVGWALATRTPAWTLVMQAVTFFGSSVVGLGLSVGCSAALLVHSRRLDRLVWLPLAAMLGSAPINFGLRYAVGRVRPGVAYIPHRVPELSHPFQRWSYPAGHTMTAVICYGLIAYCLIRARARWKGWALGLLGTGLAAIGSSRVYLGVHWPTDVLGGYLAGGAWLALCIALLAIPGSTTPLDGSRSIFGMDVEVRQREAMLVNQTTGEALARRVTRCNTFWQRLRGLMFRRPLGPDEAYWFAFRSEGVAVSSVHMAFVFFPISLVWLDGQRRVVDVRLARPFRPYYAPRQAAQYLIEGTPGLLGRVRVGDRIEFLNGGPESPCETL